MAGVTKVTDAAKGATEGATRGATNVTDTAKGATAGATKAAGAATGLKALGGDRLMGEVRNLAGALGERAVSSVTDKLGAATERLTEYAVKGGPGLITAATGKSGAGLGKAVMSAVGQKLKPGGKGGGKAQKLKVTNIIEQIDVGAPVSVCYNQWTQFTEFPTFMKKVENVEQESDEKLNWKANILWSHRSWHSTIVEQTPDERIVWRSEGDKGYVDGAVTFHSLAPELTRIVLILEYHPRGFMERTGNLWRAQGRRARLELKHFARHVMTHTVLHPDDTQGWRGEIHDSKVVSTGETDEGNEGEDTDDTEDADDTEDEKVAS